MRALEILCRFLGALPFIAAVLVIGLLWALSVPVVWALGSLKGGDK